jgi:hypothetical protein
VASSVTMKLRELFERIGPMFRGRASAEDTARALYGDDAGGTDGRRLALYNHVRGIRVRELSPVFPRTSRAAGAAWAALVYDYFVIHPWGRFDRIPDAGGLPAFVAGEATARGLPGWLGELAALEWAVFAASLAAEHGDRAAGPVRVVPSLAVHEQAHDICGWWFAPEPPPAPARRPSVVATWQAPSGAGRLVRLDDIQRAIVELIRAGGLDPDQVPASPGVTSRALVDLAKLGIVIGDVRSIASELHDPAAEHAPACGRELDRELVLVPETSVRFAGAELELASPHAGGAIATEDPDVVAVAHAFAAGSTIRDAIARLADRMTPAQVAAILDAFAEAGLVAPASLITSSRSAPDS